MSMPPALSHSIRRFRLTSQCYPQILGHWHPSANPRQPPTSIHPENSCWSRSNSATFPKGDGSISTERESRGAIIMVHAGRLLGRGACHDTIGNPNKTCPQVLGQIPGREMSRGTPIEAAFIVDAARHTRVSPKRPP